jgi:hypothetical protein
MKARKQMSEAAPKHSLYTFIIFWYDGTLTQEKLREFVAPAVIRIIDLAARFVDGERAPQPSDAVTVPAIDEVAQPAPAE